MSAFIVGRKHIEYLIESAESLARRQRSSFRWFHDGAWHTLGQDHDTPERVGQCLWCTNVASVLYRYPEDTPATAPGPIGDTYYYGRHVPKPIKFNPVQMLKACHCYDYQSCEHPEWESSEAYAIVRSIESSAMRALPGYDDAEWDIS